ncbi:MAG: MFS transporter [Thermoplasmata archaeon]
MSAPAGRGAPSPEASDRRSTSDRSILYAARTLRGIGAGALSIVFALDLARSGYPPLLIGILLGGSLAGGAAAAFALPHLEAHGSRRSVFALNAAALAIGGFLLWLAPESLLAVVVALALGGIVAGGSDVSPLGAAEQATLAGSVPPARRTHAFAVYSLLGYAGAALGSLLAAPLSVAPLATPGPGLHDPVLLLYGLIGVGLIPLYRSLSREVDRSAVRPTRAALSPEGRTTVRALASLFAVDAFGGGLIANSLVVYLFVLRFDPPLLELSILLAVSSLGAGLSLLLAVPLARRFGLVRTMVFSHLPSNLILIAIAFVPTFFGAAALWVGRSLLSQMDVPTRQSYTQSVVAPTDRAAAAGYTTAARSSQALGSPVTGGLIAAGGPWIAAPFVVAGAIKSAYDLALYAQCRRRPALEVGEPAPPPGRR